MRAILETIAPELEEMDEGARDGVMRDIRVIYEEDDSILKRVKNTEIRGT
jgi:hypothetical protein